MFAHSHLQQHAFTVAKTWKQPTLPLTGGRAKEMQRAHTMGCHSALKRREVLTRATTRVSLEDVG